MAITLRTLKGTALTYEEVDRNFSQYFYSASYDSANIYLWCTGSAGLTLPGENYSPRVGATIPFISVTPTDPGTGGGETFPGGTSDGNIQYRDKDGTKFGGEDKFFYDTNTGYVGIGSKAPKAQLNVFSTQTTSGKIRLTAIDGTPTAEGKKAYLEFWRGGLLGEIGLTSDTENTLLIKSAGTAAGIKFGIADSVKGYFTSTGFGVSSTGFTGNTTPNQTLTVIGTIGVGEGTDTANQSIIRQQPGSVINASLLPTNATSTGLLIESPSGAVGGNVTIGLNSTLLGNEAFSIIRGEKGTYLNSIATFKASGNVGIGEINPTQKLHVNGKVRTSGIVLPAAAGYYKIASTDYGSAILIGVDASTWNRNLQFGQNTGQDVFEPQMTLIAETGNLGIGTANPESYKLNVNGTTNIGGTLNVVGATTLGSTVNITGNTTINGTLTVVGNAINQENTTNEGTYTAKNITGETTSTGYAVGNWYIEGGIVTKTVSNSTTGPVIGFHNPGLWGSSIQLTADGEFKLWRQNGTTLANLSATTITATTLNGNHVGNWNGVSYDINANSYNTIVQRDNYGFIYVKHVQISEGGAERGNTGLGYFAGFNASDTFVRSYSAQAAAEALSGKTMNIVGSASTIQGYTNVDADNWSNIYDDGQNIRLLNIYNIPTTATNINYNHATVLQISGQIGHDKTQLIFNGGNGDIQYRKAWYAALPLVSTWSNIKTIIDSGNFSSYALPLAGGTMTGDLLFAQPSTITTKRGIRGTVGTSDAWFVGGSATGTDAGFLELATGKNSNEPIYVAQYTNTVFNTSPTRRAALLDPSGNSYFPGNLSIGSETNTTHRLNVAGTANITSTLTVGGQITGKNITGESTSYVAALWHKEGGLVTKTVSNSATGPAIGFWNPAAYGASIQLAALGEFKFWKESGVESANITAGIFKGNLEGTATDANFLALQRLSSLDTVNKSGVYREETPAGAFAYSATLHMNALDSRSQLIIDSYGGSGLKFRTKLDGTNPQSWTTWKDILHSNNYTTFTVAKNGVGATGTWPISITGNATTATTATSATNAPNYLPLAGGNMNLGAKILIASSGADVYGGGIELRERGFAGNTQTNWTYSPAITFHWGNINIKKLGLRSDGNLAIDNDSILLHTGNYAEYALPRTGGRLQGDVGFDAGYHLYFGAEEYFTNGAINNGGGDFGYIVFTNDDKQYGSALSSETSLLKIATSNDTAAHVADHIAIVPSGDLYLNPGTTGIYRGSLRDGREQILDTGNIQIVGAPIPAGGIIMWSGDYTTIPTGWRICDGGSFSSGRVTPNLQNRFVIGASTYEGSPKTTIESPPGQVIPKQTGGTKDAVIVDHNHDIEDPGHNHGLPADGQGGQSIDIQSLVGSGGQDEVITDNAPTGTRKTGIGIKQANGGVSGTNQNLPPYYALYYIMYGGGPLK